jgi:hypothetical protein
MSRETLEVVQESWRRNRCSGAVLGTIFRFNLGAINPSLNRLDGDCSDVFFDLQLVQAVDEVIESLGAKLRLIAALRNLGSLFRLSRNKQVELEHISQAILVTLEQAMADDFTLQLHEARSFLQEELTASGAEQGTSPARNQWLTYVKTRSNTREFLK